jgi:tetratricopeptide (TPR) repeat protein
MMLEPANPCSWYFIHNNIGCCLNHLDEFEEAEQYCRDAIRVDPTRYNAYINLGVSLEGQGQFIEAARSFVDAIKADADDLELVQHLRCLVEEHEEIANGITDINDVLKGYPFPNLDEEADDL